MNWFKKFLILLIHLKIAVLGSQELLNKGKIIPCYGCGEKFMSYGKYAEYGYAFTNRCDVCQEIWSKNE